MAKRFAVCVVSLLICAASLTCSPRRSLPSTAASSRQSTTETRTLRPQRWRIGCNRSRKASIATSQHSTPQTGEEPAVAQAKTIRLNEKIAALKTKMQQLKKIEEQMNTAPDKQISLTDPD